MKLTVVFTCAMLIMAHATNIGSSPCLGSTQVAGNGVSTKSTVEWGRNVQDITRLDATNIGGRTSNIGSLAAPESSEIQIVM